MREGGPLWFRWSRDAWFLGARFERTMPSKCLFSQVWTKFFFAKMSPTFFFINSSTVEFQVILVGLSSRLGKWFLEISLAHPFWVFLSFRKKKSHGYFGLKRGINFARKNILAVRQETHKHDSCIVNSMYHLSIFHLVRQDDRQHHSLHRSIDDLQYPYLWIDLPCYNPPRSSTVPLFNDDFVRVITMP